MVACIPCMHNVLTIHFIHYRSGSSNSFTVTILQKNNSESKIRSLTTDLPLVNRRFQFHRYAKALAHIDDVPRLSGVTGTAAGVEVFVPLHLSLLSSSVSSSSAGLGDCGGDRDIDEGVVVDDGAFPRLFRAASNPSA